MSRADKQGRNGNGRVFIKASNTTRSVLKWLPEEQKDWAEHILFIRPMLLYLHL